jgi:hypothetical protein
LPVVASTGTATISVVVVAAVTFAALPLNLTMFSPITVLKFVPVIVMIVPEVPLVGEKPDMVGIVSTVKSLTEVAVCVPTSTVILPVVAPAGAVTVSVVVVAAVTLALVPLNLTVFSLVTMLKFAPLIVTVVPAIPSVGEKSVIDGDAVVESSSLHELNTSEIAISNTAVAGIKILIKVLIRVSKEEVNGFIES